MPIRNEKSTTLSLAKIIAIRSETFSAIKYHGAKVVSLGDAVERLDATLLAMSSGRGIDSQQALVDAARNLSALLDGESV